MSTGAAELNPFEQRVCEYLLKNPEVIMEALQLVNALGAACTPSFAVHESPRPVPEIQFENGEGKAMSLADCRRKVVLFNIWANGHAPCRRQMPTLERLQATLGGPLDRKGLPGRAGVLPGARCRGAPDLPR
jgi:hypothetical protein